MPSLRLPCSFPSRTGTHTRRRPGPTHSSPRRLPRTWRRLGPALPSCEGRGGCAELTWRALRAPALERKGAGRRGAPSRSAPVAPVLVARHRPTTLIKRHQEIGSKDAGSSGTANIDKAAHGGERCACCRICSCKQLAAYCSVVDTCAAARLHTTAVCTTYYTVTPMRRLPVYDSE